MRCAQSSESPPRFLTYPDNPELWYPAHD